MHFKISTMTWLRLATTLCVYICISELCQGDLSRTLQGFETLHTSDLRHKIAKREIYSQNPNERQVEFDAHSRHFKLNLRRSSSILAKDFSVVVVGADNKETPVDINVNMYHGYVADEPDSSVVNAYWEDDDTLTATIKTSSDVYVVEPSWRHLPPSSNYTMITYKASDMNMEKDLGKSFCGYIKEDWPVDNTTLDEDNKKLEGIRAKRQTDDCVTNGHTTCPLLLVADYKFFNEMGGSNRIKTTSYLIGHIDKVDSLYRGHTFSGCKPGLGFEIKKIIINELPTTGYNMQKTDWDTKDLLEQFSADLTFSQYCLAHLFTHTGFDNGVLGLAYIGSPRSYSVGGLCSPSYVRGGVKMYLNTGWSSSLNRYGRKLLSQEYMLVSAHEFGHNWGSEHDPDISECSPSGSGGGKHLMYMYSVTGIDPNNKLFSPCSKRAIGAVLSAKADNNCFVKKTVGFCGNGVIERDNGEQCDAGDSGTSGAASDDCCDASCKLKPTAQCSDKNQECCQKCKFDQSSRVCFSGQGVTCEGEARCNGLSGDCPTPPPKPDGSACLDKGKCRNGSCVSLCEFNKKISCICDAVENSCKWCCKDTVSSVCQPYSNGGKPAFDLPNGMPCVQGYCSNGTCHKQSGHDLVQRLWDVIENITADKLVAFMRANIVGTVIVLSLILWIPASIIVSCVDKSREKKAKEENLWFNDTTALIHPHDVAQPGPGTLRIINAGLKDRPTIPRNGKQTRV